VPATISLFLFTLTRIHSHRYYRFFAFESLFVIVLLNSDVWFVDPFSAIQIISWILLASSLYVAIEGFRQLRHEGSPRGYIEDTTELVTVGIYRYIRHPLYCSLFLGGIGAFLKNPSLVSFLFLVILTLFVYATAKVEEINNLNKFGESYQKYMKTTKMFIPFWI